MYKFSYLLTIILTTLENEKKSGFWLLIEKNEGARSMYSLPLHGRSFL